MGIYVKGMGMPKGCDVCLLGDIVCGYDEDHIDRDCPLIEVPEPHGDLVDHSEIGEILIKALDECEISEEDKSYVLRMVWIAPTVIEGTE